MPQLLAKGATSYALLLFVLFNSKNAHLICAQATASNLSFYLSISATQLDAVE